MLLIYLHEISHLETESEIFIIQIVSCLWKLETVFVFGRRATLEGEDSENMGDTEEQRG